MKAVETLTAKGIPTSVRIDPVIPLVNDKPEALIKTLASIGVKHIKASTYKVRPDNWKRSSSTMPRIAQKLKPLYFERGERISGYIYLSEDVRLQLMKTIGALVAETDMTFGTCREGLSQLNTAACDGSHLLPTMQQIH